MAAYGTDPRKYLPPHTPQLATKLSHDGVDDCLVCSVLALVNGASLGEATRSPQGHEPTTTQLVRIAVRMRNKLDDPDTAVGEQQSGPLPASAAGRMVALMWPAYPTLRTDDIDFKALVALLLDEHVAVLAANPAHIKGPSPLKRVGDGPGAVRKERRRATGSGVSFNPDLVFGAPDAIGDVKYKLADGTWTRSDLYQVVAFAAAFGVTEALLVRFRARDVQRALDVQAGDIQVHEVTWLASDDEHPRAAGDAMADEIAAWLRHRVDRPGALAA